MRIRGKVEVGQFSGKAREEKLRWSVRLGYIGKYCRALRLPGSGVNPF